MCSLSDLSEFTGVVVRPNCFLYTYALQKTDLRNSFSKLRLNLAPTLVFKFYLLWI